MTDQYVAIVMAPNSRGPEYVYGPFPCSREDEIYEKLSRYYKDYNDDYQILVRLLEPISAIPTK